MKTELMIKLNDLERVKKFTDIVSKFQSDIDIIRGRYFIDAKSTLGIYTIDLTKPLSVRIITCDDTEIDKFNECMKEFM